MKISWRWLGRHVDLTGLTPEGVADDLTLSVAEVEGLEPFAPALDVVTVGHVVEREQHPDADKLSLCKVDVGGEEALQIVCGAPNVRQGLKVAVAQIGTVLPGDFKIKKSKIRGVESRGMICSERELGLGEEHDGIWELPEDAPVGRPVSESSAAVDWVIEIDNKSITHRPDLWGHRGIAAEVAALHRRELLPLDTSLEGLGEAPAFPVDIQAEGCGRYLALPLSGARVEKSPEWMRWLLLAVGQRPLNVLVDVSNFVMLDLGQPNHLFDARRLSPEGIEVRGARDGESMTTLDGFDRALVPEDMLICSGGSPVALAGIMGGEASKVDADTSELLLEVAAFDAVTVRRTSARLGLRSDASARFEKSLDPHLPLAAAGHLVRTLQAIQPEIRLPAGLSDVGAWQDPSLTVRLRPERVRAILGVDVSDADVQDILTRLGFGLEAVPGGFDVRVPAPRATKDVRLEEDLIEEVGRVWRYGNVPARPLVGALTPPPRDEAWQRRMLVRSIEDRLAGGARFHQALSASFVSDDLLTTLGAQDAPHVEVVNPVAEGLARVRRSVMPSLLGLLEGNRRQREDVRLFEVGKGYLPEAANERGEPLERHELGLVWAGPPTPDGARFDAGRNARLQGVLVDLVGALQRPALVWDRARDEELESWAHPGRALVGRFEPDGPLAVLLAPLEPGLLRRLGLVEELGSEVAVACVDIGVLLGSQAQGSSYEPIPSHPGIKIDVALALPEDLPARDAVQAIERCGKGLVAGIELFDVYTGENVGAGRKSLAWHVTLQAQGRTLSDKDGQKFLSRLEREAQKLGGELRRE